MEKYLNAKIYKIVCNITSEIYYGSTCEKTIARRLAQHVASFKRFKAGKHNFITSFRIIERGDYDAVLVENCECTNRDELHKRERFYIENNECVNKCVPGRTKEDWYATNREALMKRMTAYNETNREAINAKMREHMAKKRAEKKASKLEDKESL